MLAWVGFLKKARYMYVYISIDFPNLWFVHIWYGY